MSLRSSVSASVPSPHKKTGVKRVIQAFGYSVSGIGSALKHEAAFRQEAILALIMVPAAILLPVGLVGKVLLIGAVFAVLVVELLNSALEWVVDYISMDRHPMAKRVKDMGSGAVFLSLVCCALIWCLVVASEWSEIYETVR